MNSFSYLRSLKAKYSLLIYFLVLLLFIILLLMFIFKSYDVYTTKGYVECSDNCKISISVNYLDVNKFNKVDKIKLNKENIVVKNINISEIMLDDSSKSNYQIVTLEVDQLDNGILNTFQDVKLYSNEELIINKIINVLL